MKFLKKRFISFICIGLFFSHNELMQASSLQVSPEMMTMLLAAVLTESQMNQQSQISENQMDQDNYLERKLQALHASKDINIPLVERLLFQSVGGYKPSHQQYDTYIDAAYELAMLDNSPISMHHIQTALHNARGHQVDLKLNDDSKHRLSIHELGHAIAIIYTLYRSTVLHHVEVVSRKVSPEFASVGHNVAIPIKAIQTPDDELYNNIIVALAGGVAVQVYSGKGKSLENLLSNVECYSDVQQAFDYAKKIAARNRLNDSYYRFIPFYIDMKIRYDQFSYAQRAELQVDVDLIIAQCYDEAYQFITDHKHEIDLAIDLLQKNGSISGDDLYDLFNAPKPLYDFESGPLPKKLVKNYALRGAYDKHDTEGL